MRSGEENGDWLAERSVACLYPLLLAPTDFY